VILVVFSRENGASPLQGEWASPGRAGGSPVGGGN